MQTGEHYSSSQQQYYKFPRQNIVQSRPLEAAMEYSSDDDQVETILTELLHESEEWLKRAIVKYQERCLKKLKGTVKVKAQKLRRNLSVGSPRVTSRGLGGEEALKLERFKIKTPNLGVVQEEDHGSVDHLTDQRGELMLPPLLGPWRGGLPSTPPPSSPPSSADPARGIPAAGRIVAALRPAVGEAVVGEERWWKAPLFPLPPHNPWWWGSLVGPHLPSPAAATGTPPHHMRLCRCGYTTFLGSFSFYYVGHETAKGTRDSGEFEDWKQVEDVTGGTTRVSGIHT
ncbi:hypothetical protein Sjap_001247 [Stephania japonica]|uniref:Uncharacterized protein n=1 Tax=Stephania japonica TaxID=461633 RepID=A0AAP0KLW2_9MAGN